MTNTTDFQISERFAIDSDDLNELLAPLIDLTHESSSLVVGYGIPQAGVRGTMIPYFHVCGTYTDVEPLRVLIVGGWAGNEKTTSFVIARLLAAMEARLSLVAGLEITAYPAANLEARREGIAFTPDQKQEAMRCWVDSPCSLVRVMENEMRRYDYDLVLVLRENPASTGTQVEAWVAQETQRTVIDQALRQSAEGGEAPTWKFNPKKSVHSRVFTPIPNSAVQPAEVVISLPGKAREGESASSGLGLLLGLLHALREARQDGTL